MPQEMHRSSVFAEVLFVFALECLEIRWVLFFLSDSTLCLAGLLGGLFDHPFFALIFSEPFRGLIHFVLIRVTLEAKFCDKEI